MQSKHALAHVYGVCLDAQKMSVCTSIHKKSCRPHQLLCGKAANGSSLTTGARLQGSHFSICSDQPQTPTALHQLRFSQKGPHLHLDPASPLSLQHLTSGRAASRYLQISPIPSANPPWAPGAHIYTRNPIRIHTPIARPLRSMAPKILIKACRTARQTDTAYIPPGRPKTQPAPAARRGKKFPPSAGQVKDWSNVHEGQCQEGDVAADAQHS